MFLWGRGGGAERERAREKAYIDLVLRKTNEIGDKYHL